MEKPLLADKVRDLVVAYWRLGSTETEIGSVSFCPLEELAITRYAWTVTRTRKTVPHGGNTIEPGERLLIP